MLYKGCDILGNQFSGRKNCHCHILTRVKTKKHVVKSHNDILISFASKVQ